MHIMKLIIPLIIIFLSISCEVTVVENCDIDGCTNEDAFNYDVTATNDDGSCIIDNISGTWTLTGWWNNDDSDCVGDATDDSEIELWGGTTILTISGTALLEDGGGTAGTLIMAATDSYNYSDNYTGSWTMTGNALNITYNETSVPYPTSYTLGTDASTLMGNIVVSDECNQYTFTKNQ